MTIKHSTFQRPLSVTTRNGQNLFERFLICALFPFLETLTKSLCTKFQWNSLRDIYRVYMHKAIEVINDPPKACSGGQYRCFGGSRGGSGCIANFFWRKFANKEEWGEDWLWFTRSPPESARPHWLPTYARLIRPCYDNQMSLLPSRSPLTLWLLQIWLHS